MHTKLINIYTFMYMSQVILKNPNYAIILEDIKNDLDNYIEEYEGEKMKKIWILSMLVTSLLLLVACNGESTELTTETSTAPTTIDTTTETPTTQAPTTEAQTTGVVDTVPPVLSGVDDSLAYLNEPFDPLAGVSAWDEVDGDLTSEISYAGIVNTEQVGLYFLRYSVIDQSGNRTEASRYITVEKRPDEEEPDELAISVSKPYLFVNVDEPLILSDYIYRNEDGEITIDQGSFTQISENLSILDGSLVAHTSGINTFEYSYGGESFLVYVFSKLSEETDYLVYSMDFSELADGPIPSDYIIETMNGGSARILNGFLTIDSPAIEDPTRVLLPTYLSGLKNYIIDVDFSILTTVESTRWASVMYRFSPDNYFQMAIRQGAMAVNGVEFAKAINGQWNVPITTAYSEGINSEKLYHLTIDLYNSNVKEYIDNELLIEYGSAGDYLKGSIGVQASGAKAIYNNFEIRIPESYIDNSSIEYQNIADVYVPDTNIVLAPTVIQTVETQSDIDQLGEDVRATIAMFDLNDALNAINDQGEEIIEFNNILELVKNRTIPAYRINNIEDASLLSKELGTLGVRDAFIVSSSTEVIQTARNEYNLIRGVYQVLYNVEKPTLTDIDLISIVKATNASGASVVMLPIEYASHYNVDYIQKRLVTVWVDTSLTTDVDIYQAIVSGSHGLVNHDTLNVYTIFDTFAENSLTRVPLIIGHRGFASQAPENTVEGSWLAYEAGADVIELDVYLTTDNQIVVMHDTTTDRTTDGKLTVENSTLAELRELTITDNFGDFSNIPVPSLEEYFIRFKDEDVRLFIEIKSTNTNIVPALKTLIDTYDFYDQAIVITFHTAQATIMHEVLPEISVGLLNSGLLYGDNVNSSIYSAVNQVVPLKTTINPYFEPITHEMLLGLQARGITAWPWTLNVPTDFYDQFMLGVGGLTTDYTNWISNELIEFDVSGKDFTYSISNPSSIELLGRFGNRAGLDYEYPYQYILLSGLETGITFGTRNSITGASITGDVYLLPYLDTTLSNGTTLRLYDDVVHIKIVD